MEENNEQQNERKPEIRKTMTVHEFFQWTRDILAEERENLLAAAQEPAEPAAEPIKEEPHTIRIDTTIDPEMQAKFDPQSPEFDPALLRQKISEVGSSNYMQHIATRLKDAIGSSITADELSQAIQIMGEAIQGIANSLMRLAPMNALESMLDILSEADFDALEELEPYLMAELEKPEYGGKDLMELWDESADENGEAVPGNLYDQAIRNAKAAMLANKKELPKVTVTGKVSNVEYPLDKINSNIWALLVTADKTGQLTFATERRGSKKQADVIYSINFEELEQETGVTITKKLTAFDKRVYIAASALFNGGNDVVTVAQIYAAMGNSGRPSANDIKKINDSLTKMAAAHIYLNNTSENAVYPQYKKFVYDASLLPMERISAIVNGQATDTAVHLFREPPLISFAKERRQITTVSRQLLESPLSKTDANLQLDDYLIEQISHIKKSKGKISNKMLYETIFKKTGIKEKMQRSRAREKISRYLEHYKKCGFIKDYKEAADGITIYF